MGHMEFPSDPPRNKFSLLGSSGPPSARPRPAGPNMSSFCSRLPLSEGDPLEIEQS